MSKKEDKDLNELVDVVLEGVVGTSEPKKSLPIRAGVLVPASAPSHSEKSRIEYYNDMVRRQETFVENDDIVRSLQRKEDPIKTLSKLQERMAKAAATLEFMKLENQRNGYNANSYQITSKQVAAIKDIAYIELEMCKLSATVINLGDPRLQGIFKMLIDTFRDVAQDVLQPEQFDLLWNKLENSLEGWEEKAESFLR